MRGGETLAQQTGFVAHEDIQQASALKNTHKTSQNSRHIRKRNTRNARRSKPTSDGDLQPTRAFSRINSQNVTPKTLASESSVAPVRRSFDLSDFLPASAPSEKRLQNELGQLWEYLESIGEHLLDLEGKFPIPPLNYSGYFGPAQRARGITLISSHCNRLGLQLQTQFRAFDLFHRICTATPFERYHSALKAATSLYIAAKLEELYPPQAVCFISLDPIQQVLPENILKLEALVLFHLDYNLSRALPCHFAQLLALRYELKGQSRQELLRLCLHSVTNESLWMGGGSMLAMACVWVVNNGRMEGVVDDEMRWRVEAVRGLLG